MPRERIRTLSQRLPETPKERRQGYGCHPGPIRPTQRLTAPNGGGIVRGSMTEKKWLLLCQRRIKIQQAAESPWPGSARFLLSALRPSGRLKWVRAPARKTRLAANGKPNALLAPPGGGKWSLNPSAKTQPGGPKSARLGAAFMGFSVFRSADLAPEAVENHRKLGAGGSAGGVQGAVRGAGHDTVSHGPLHGLHSVAGYGIRVRIDG